MQVMSRGQYEKFFESKSIILRPQTNNPRKYYMSNAIHGISGLRDYQDRLLNNQSRGEEQIILSYMNRAKENLRDAKRRWIYYCEDRGIKSIVPVGHFADQINLCEAELRVFKKEAMCINKMLRDYEIKQERNRINAAVAC